MNDEQLSTLFRADTGDEPALPPDFAGATLARARRSVRRRRTASAVGAGALVLVIITIIGFVPRLGRAPDHPPAESSGPSLPEEFATLSRFTSRAADDPAGRAIALYEYGESDVAWQTLVAGADRDTYRRVDTEEVAPAVLLSPDGRYVLYFKASRETDEFRLLDLTTGQSEVRHSVEWMSNVGASITMLAWSPDGRYVAYAVPHPSPNDGRAESSIGVGGFLRDVAILDVVNDTNVLFSVNTPIHGAAFSPDSQRVAVMGDPWSPIITVNGEQVGTWTRPTRIEYSQYGPSPIAWSPDGTLLAVGLEARPTSMGQVTFSGPSTMVVDLSGTDRAVGVDLTGRLLGWRSPTSVVVLGALEQDLANGDPGLQVLMEISIVDGSRTVLSRFPRKDRCAVTGRCTAYHIQLATNLLPQVGLRTSDPDWGSGPLIVHVGLIVAAGTIGTAFVVIVIWRRRVGRRRRAAVALTRAT
jgi:hypothetical protein